MTDRDDPASRRTAAIVLAVGVTSALHIGKLPVAIPVLRDALQLTLVQAGFLLSLVQLAGMTLGLAVGLTADRLGPRQVMLIGLVLLALGSVVGALAPGTGVLLLSRVVEGVGFLLSVLPAPGLLRRRVRHAPTLSRALGWWGAYMPLGTALALLLGGVLMDQVGWRGTWVALSVLSLGSAVLLARRVAPDEASAAAKSGLAAVAWGPRLRKTLTAPGPW
ncbi:MAG: MFS transporter [Hydrogenophaga sp.]